MKWADRVTNDEVLRKKTPESNKKVQNILVMVYIPQKVSAATGHRGTAGRKERMEKKTFQNA